MLRKQVVALAWAVKIATLHPNEWREGFIESADMLGVRFPENPIGKTLKWGEVNFDHQYVVFVLL
jgi:hypothetical protein